MTPQDFLNNGWPEASAWVLALVALFFLVRTRGRKMALEEGQVTAAGRVFHVDDIARLDLRRWKMKGWLLRR